MKHSPASRQSDGPAALGGILDVSRETSDRLAIYADLIQRWNPTVNLVARGDLPTLWHRHIADAAQLAPLIPAGTERAIDLGSGGGLPALVLAIVTGIAFDLIESDRRKAAFLREAARETAAPARVHACRIEATNLPPARLVTARALAPLPVLLGLAHRFLTKDGVFLFPKGISAETELTATARLWHMKVTRFPSRTDQAATIFRISEVSRVHSPD